MFSFVFGIPLSFGVVAHRPRARPRRPVGRVQASVGRGEAALIVSVLLVGAFVLGPASNRDARRRWRHDRSAHRRCHLRRRRVRPSRTRAQRLRPGEGSSDVAASSNKMDRRRSARDRDVLRARRQSSPRGGAAARGQPTAATSDSTGAVCGNIVGAANGVRRRCGPEPARDLRRTRGDRTRRRRPL